ncbi:MAG: polysaccharide biosynthesis C-terminal domain-containing protein [Oscillospiraceae bacterium]|nr:polysaccharide biosynthesis C-terminal domain-containing protein [Oscillospiraceae bacterium]
MSNKPDSQNRYRTLAGNIVILGIGQFSSKLLVYVMLKFYTSMLGTSGYGDMTNLINAGSLLISVFSLSIAEGVLRFALEKNNDGRMVFSIGINIAVCGCVVFAAFVPLVGLIPMLAGYEWMLFIYVLAGAIKEVCGIFVRARVSVKLFAVDGIITTVSMIIFNLLLLGVFNFGINGYLWSVILSNLTSIVFLNIVAKLYKQYRPLKNDKSLCVSMMSYSIPLMPTTIMWWIINMSDGFMVTYFLGSDSNGIYGFAYKFPNLAAVVVGIFAQAWHMSAITERNSRTVSNFYSNIFSMMQTVVFIACAGIMLILRPFIMPFFGTEAFAPAYFYVPVLLGAVIFQCFNNFLSSIYEASRKTTHALISSAIGAAANIGLNFLMIPVMGILGAALATLASYLIVFIYRVIDTKKLLYMTIYWVKVVVNIILLAGMSLSIMLLEYGLWQNVINAVIFIVIAAINFKTCVQAVKLILNKKKEKKDNTNETVS